jgi:putative transposase
MRFADSTFAQLLKPIDRRWFQKVVDRHNGDAYDKRFQSWSHLVALIYAQLARTDGLRDLELTFNANSQHHYHLGTAKLARSTLSDANARRPVAIFEEVFTQLVAKADRLTRREGQAMVRLIDSSPIPLGQLFNWTTWNGRIRGMKLHVVYDPLNDVPHRIEITPANVNDVEIGQKSVIEAGTIYVFDKAYCHFGWWKKINDAKAFFVTRKKVNTRLRAARHRKIGDPKGGDPKGGDPKGDGFEVLADDEVKLVSKSNSRLPIPLRRIKIKRDAGGIIVLLTNDLTRNAVEIAALYKSRWQIELLFRWIKQHLDIRKFLGNNDNAVRLQVIAAMIAYLLLRIAARVHRVTLLPIRFAELVSKLLFSRRSLANITQPPPVNPSKPQLPTAPNQFEFCYG